MNIDYAPDGNVLKAFMNSDAFFRGIRGPVASGKSVACCLEVFRRAAQQERDKTGKRRTRWAIVRNTNPQLKTTTIKTWLDWFPESEFGKLNRSVPFTHHIKVNDLDMEVIFLALDRPDDVKKLLSLELTGVWVNEAREVPKSIIDACTMRVLRYPAKKDGGATWSGVICDTNAPEEDHWWPVMSGEAPLPDYMTQDDRMTLVKPEGWEFYTQPPGMVEVRKNDLITGYTLNPRRENAKFVDTKYYGTIIGGKQRHWINVYILNRLGSTHDGKPVYSSYNDDVHTAKHPLGFVPHVPVYIGLDFGLTPAAVYSQRMPDGQWRILRETVASDLGVKRFAQVLKQDIAEWCPGHSLYIYGDPAGDYRSQTDEETPFRILRANGVQAIPAPSNDPVIRVESVAQVIDRMIDGKPGLLVDTSCTMLRSGFLSGYHYKRMAVGGAARYDDKPDKNKYSHVHDALQYMMLGGGESRKLVTRPAEKVTTKPRSTYSVFDRQKRQRRQSSNRGYNSRVYE